MTLESLDSSYYPSDSASASDSDVPLSKSNRNANALDIWDAVGILAGAILILTATAYLSRGRVLWEDEMLGWMLLHDPSWHHMVDAWKAGADGGGFAFYLIGRAWFFLAGSSDLAFRLYSATCFAAAFAITWLAARRFYSTGIVCFACFNTFFFSRTFVLHMREGRFYGLLVLAVALAVWLALRLSGPSRPIRPRWYMATFMIHGLLTTSHLLGIVFSFILLAATAVLDLLQSQPRPMLYIAGAASWLLLFFERANIFASIAVGKPHFWIKPPTVWDILAVYDGVSPEIAWVVFSLLCRVTWTLWKNPDERKSALGTAYAERKPVYIIAGALLLVPAGFLLEGLLGTWIFNNRYLLPILLGVVYLTAEALQLLSPAALALYSRRPAQVRSLGGVWLTGYAALLLFWVFHHVADFTPSAKDYTAQLTAKLPKDLPVVCEDAFSFTELIGRQHASGVRYGFLLDWDQTISPSAPALEVTQFHLMQNWKRVGYFSDAIQPLQEFLRNHNRFYILHTAPIKPANEPPEIGNPLVQRFQRNAAYEVRPYTQLDRQLIRDTVWLVCLGSCDAPSRTASMPAH